MVGLATVLTLGEVGRFPRGRQVAAYVGLIPSEDSSGQRRRLGAITKQGSSFLRFLLVQAAASAVKGDAEWARVYKRLARKKHHGVAKVAIARKLVVRLYWMLSSWLNSYCDAALRQRVLSALNYLLRDLLA